MDVLLAFAHPDDESIFFGGTAALLAEAGAGVHFVCATRGEGGEAGEPPLCPPGELGRVRSEELACAVRALGGGALAFLGYADPPVDAQGEGRAFQAQLEELGCRLAEQVRAAGAAALVTHGSNGEYGHPAHVLMQRGAWAACRQLGDNAPALYGFSAAFAGHPRARLANRDDPAHLVIDLGPAFEAKLAAARCHRTQAALFVRRASREAGRPVALDEVLMRLESLHLARPAAGGAPRDPLIAFLRRHAPDRVREG